MMQDELVAGDAAAPSGDVAAALARGEALLGHAPDLAVEQALEILAVAPSDPRAHALHGRALARCGRTAEAIVALRRPEAAGHGSPDAWRLLGDLLSVAGDRAGADQAYGEQIRTSVRDPRLLRAAAALAQNDLPEAEFLLREHLKTAPTDVAAIRMLAELAGRIGRYPDAIKLLRRAVDLAPSFTPARHNLAIVLYRNNHTDEALTLVDELVAADPANPAFHGLAGAVTMKIGAVERATVHFEKALEKAPDQAKLWMSYGHALKTAGRTAEGVQAYRRAVTLDPRLGEAWWSLANLKTFRFTPEEVAAMRAILAGPDLDDEGRFHLAFAVGKADEDAGRYPSAFTAYAEGARLRRAQLDYDGAAISTRVARLCQALTPARLARHDGHGCQARDPIFVVGMPRSGSTLVEQILASHPEVEGTQELPDINVLALRLADEAEDYAGRLAQLDGAQLRAMGEEYLARTRVQRRTGRPLFIDKMPNNWLHVGLIRLILPRATVIDVRRHPLACCFSNFKQHFARGQAFSYDLADVGRYYRDYVRMMAHIDAILPGYVHRVIYENLVADTEGEVRRLLAHVGLPFDAACLAFHRNERAVRTASSEQVRQPIFRDGLERWRHFDPWLGPLREALGDVVDAYPEPPANR